MLEIKENEILANHSTFRIGGPARYFVIAKNKEEILEAINFAKQKNLPYFILGGGSNILFHDEGFNGVVIKILNTKYQILDTNVVVSAGTPFTLLISKTIEASLSGLEWGIGIPGTIGGCVAGNCGAYGHNIAESVLSVSVLDRNGNIKRCLSKECGFDYRKSRFKEKNNQEILLEIELKLEKGDKEESQRIMKDILTKRKDRIPPHPSIGCIFKNPKPLSAGSLIEQCGLKGKQIGGAQISKQHANFIINIGGAKAKDILELITLCKKKVKNKFNIDLEEEIVIV